MIRTIKGGSRELRVPSVRFVREQVGAPERALQSRLLECFQRHTAIKRAYLVQISSGDQLGVALCLKKINGPDRALIKEIGDIFADIFGCHEHLDILFLNDVQEASLKRVCPAFFSLMPNR